MGLVSLLFIAAFTLLYLKKSMEGNKPEFIEKGAAKIEENIDTLALWALGYGLLAFILTPVMIRYAGLDMLVRLAVNLMIVLMALPYSLEHVLSKYGDRINAKIAEELRRVVGIISGNEKIMAWLGAVLTLFLFAALFR